MKEKARVVKTYATSAMYLVAPVAAGVATTFAMNPMVFAGGAADLINEIIKLMAKLITVLGAILALVGIINYASAHSEGDGPAQNKAVGKIAAGVMLVALSVFITKTDFTKFMELS